MTPGMIGVSPRQVSGTPKTGLGYHPSPERRASAAMPRAVSASCGHAGGLSCLAMRTQKMSSVSSLQIRNVHS